jgi:hypothetical protein
MSLSSCGGSSTGPGQAVVADGPLVCCVMRRTDFERLLGPYDELWRYEALRKVSKPKKVEALPDSNMYQTLAIASSGSGLHVLGA